MFRRLSDPAGAAARVTILVEGRRVECRAGESLGAALLAAGVDTFRTTPVTGAPRAPYCMMGVCYDCLVTIDGVANQQACMTAVREGMRVERQVGARKIEP